MHGQQVAVGMTIPTATGQHITHRQEELYMQHRQQGITQEIAAAKSVISNRTARRIEQSNTLPHAKADRDWRPREDPLEAVWETELVVLLNAKPELTPITLLEYLQGALSKPI